jgi:hypothetical protein
VSAYADELKRAKRKPLKTNNMNELKLTIEEMQLGYMEAKVQQLNPNVTDRNPNDHGYDTEEELFDKLIQLSPITNVPFIMNRISARQRADFWDRVRVVNAYELDGMSEREYMVTLKKELYTQYLRNQ